MLWLYSHSKILQLVMLKIHLMQSLSDILTYKESGVHINL